MPDSERLAHAVLAVLVRLALFRLELGTIVGLARIRFHSTILNSSTSKLLRLPRVCPLWLGAGPHPGQDLTQAGPSACDFIHQDRLRCLAMLVVKLFVSRCTV